MQEKIKDRAAIGVTLRLEYHVNRGTFLSHRRKRTLGKGAVDRKTNIAIVKVETMLSVS